MKIRDFALTLIASGAVVATGVPAQTTDTSSTSSATTDNSGTTSSSSSKKHHKKHAHRSSASASAKDPANGSSTQANDQKGIPAGNSSQSGLSPDRKTTDEHGNTRVTGTDAMNTSSQVKVSNDNDTGQQGTSSGVSGATSTPAVTPSGTNNTSAPSGSGPNSRDTGAKPRK
jgi:hypothetical protein